MKAYEFTIDNALEYVLTGKFEALSPNWMHETMELIDYELFVISKGPLYLSYQNQDFTVNTGETLLLPPGQPPANLRRGFRPSDCSFYWMHFTSSHPVTPVITEDGVTDTLSYLTENNIRLLIPQYCRTLNTEKIIVLMKQLQDAVRSQYDRLTINYMTTLILCEIHNQHIRQLNVSIPAKNQRQMFQDILDYIKRHIQENIRVADIAGHFGYNDKYLSHMFSSIAGMSLKRYIMKAKIDEANFMLTDTNMTILEISVALGFADSHNFMKFYKKMTGLTPSEYRNAFSKRMLYHK